MISGKGMYLWKIYLCEGGNVDTIANLAQQAGLSHVLIKIADGTNIYNYDWTNHRDLVPPLVSALRARGIQPWGWHYIYGRDPAGEATVAAQRIRQLGLDGYVIDAEMEFEASGMANAARTFMITLRNQMPSGVPIGLSSFRFPSYHPAFPWNEFLSRCDFNMPQVYWVTAHNPADQLIRSVREFRAMFPNQPIAATGSAYKYGTWVPSASEIRTFMATAVNLGLLAANFWEWHLTRDTLDSSIWNAIAAFSWPASPQPQPQDITEEYIAALNTHDPDKVVALYTDRAVHVNTARTVTGKDAIRSWYVSLFNDILPNATFRLTGRSGTGNSRHFTWEATSTAGTVRNGNDVLGLLDGKIAYHYTFFTVEH